MLNTAFLARVSSCNRIPKHAPEHSFTCIVSLLQGPSRPRRKGITKEEREMARLLHRTHLLCLLSRGLLFDQAASDPLLQVTGWAAKPLIPCHMGVIMHLHHYVLLCFSSFRPWHFASCLRSHHNLSQGVTRISDHAIWRISSIIHHSAAWDFPFPYGQDFANGLDLLTHWHV